MVMSETNECGPSVAPAPLDAPDVSQGPAPLINTSAELGIVIPESLKRISDDCQANGMLLSRNEKTNEHTFSLPVCEDKMQRLLHADSMGSRQREMARGCTN